MRATDLALLTAAVIAFLMAVEDRSRVSVTAPDIRAVVEDAMITCPLRKPDFATVLQAAFLGDATVLVEQQSQTRVREIKDC